MRSSWWKVLGVLLMLYVIIMGMTTPLKPGISDVFPINAEVGKEVTFRVEGYNTHFDEGTRVWLKYDSMYSIQAHDIDVKEPYLLSANIKLPAALPRKGGVGTLALIVDSPEDGPSVLPSAVFLKSEVEADATQWIGKISNLSALDRTRFPNRNILNETIRNTFFHVPLWFSMFILLVASTVYSTKYLRKGRLDDDIIASALVRVAVLFGVLGMLTGSIWARYTWGTFWTSDIKLNMSAVAMLIYVAYIILRSSITDVDRRAKLSSGYAIFAFVALIPLIFVIPRLTDSLHPGNGGNPALGSDDMDNTLRMIFYPAILGFTLIGLWMTSHIIRFERLNKIWIERDRDMG